MKKEINLIGTYYLLMKDDEVVYICNNETLANKMLAKANSKINGITLKKEYSWNFDKENLIFLIKEVGSKSLKEKIKVK